MEGMTSMKRALVFLLLGPALAVAAWLTYVAAVEGLRGHFVGASAMILFIFTFFVAAITGLVDGYLARALPVYLRVPVTAIAGGTIAVSLVLGLAWTMVLHFITLPQWIWMPFAIGGALCMGGCSLLSSEYGRGQRLAMPLYR
jgi:hypothetical protein